MSDESEQIGGDEGFSASPGEGERGSGAGERESGRTNEQAVEQPPDMGLQLQLSPLSIQAAALVKCIDGLSNIFWISFAGTFLSIFFVSLNQLDANAASDHILLGEYQVPKDILPLAAVSFALFVFWLTANRLKVLNQALHSTLLPTAAVHEIFRLNPPVLHIFQKDNVERWSLASGVTVFLINWSVFFSNSMSLTWSSALQQGAYSGRFSPWLLAAYLLLIVAVIVYGSRAIIPRMRTILSALHNVDFRLGWPRLTITAALGAAVFLFGQWDQVRPPGEISGNLLGPAVANAIDGETLFAGGSEIKLFGIDSVESDQVCQDQHGADYACGRLATQALQSLLQSNLVVCLPLFAVSDYRVVGNCEIAQVDGTAPRSPIEFMEETRPNNLSLIMVAEGHAVAIGIGDRLFGSYQNKAQADRRGIWQGAFQPPSSWRRRAENP